MGACKVDGFRQIRSSDEKGLWEITERVIWIMIYAWP